MSRILCRNMGDSGKLRFYELDHESKTRLLKTHSYTSNRLAMEPGTSEEKQLERDANPTTRPKSPITNLPCGSGVAGGSRKGSRTCRMSPVWALEPTACRRCGGGGQESLYGRPITDKVLWRGEPSSIWRGSQALTQGEIMRYLNRRVTKAVAALGTWFIPPRTILDITPLRLFSFVFFARSICYFLLYYVFSPPPINRNNSDPGSLSRLFSSSLLPSTVVCAFITTPGILHPFLPYST